MVRVFYVSGSTTTSEEEAPDVSLMDTPYEMEFGAELVVDDIDEKSADDDDDADASTGLVFSLGALATAAVMTMF